MRMAIYKTGETGLQTTVSDGMCDYTDYTVAEYLEKLGPEYACIPLDDAVDRIMAAQNSQFVKPWAEISEDVWVDALEVLPPNRWMNCKGIEFFQISERTIGNLTATYAKVNERYFTATRSIFDDYGSLAAQIAVII